MKSWCEEMAATYYEKLNDGVVDISVIANELAKKWKSNDFQSVNFAAAEVAGCLIRKQKVSWGDRKNGTFDVWNLEGWDADQRIEREMKELDHLADGFGVCSFKFNTGEQESGGNAR